MRAPDAISGLFHNVLEIGVNVVRPIGRSKTSHNSLWKGSTFQGAVRRWQVVCKPNISGGLLVAFFKLSTDWVGSHWLLQPNGLHQSLVYSGATLPGCGMQDWARLITDWVASMAEFPRCPSGEFLNQVDGGHFHA
jgi:hypothetical protein